MLQELRRSRGSWKEKDRATSEQEFNQQIIEEFRANEGRVGGQFEGTPLLLLHHTGAKSGAQRVNPMMYQAVGDSYAVLPPTPPGPTQPRSAMQPPTGTSSPKPRLFNVHLTATESGLR